MRWVLHLNLVIDRFKCYSEHVGVGVGVGVVECGLNSTYSMNLYVQCIVSSETDCSLSVCLSVWLSFGLTQQVALLWQRDRARYLSVEILQLQNISLENTIVWHYLRDSTFSRFDTTPECDRETHRHTHTHTQTHDDGITALSIASRGKNHTSRLDRFFVHVA